MALDALRLDPAYRVVGLVSGLCPATDRLAIHEVRGELLRSQASALGLSFSEVPIERGASNKDYENAWRSFLTRRQAEGITRIAFGDLFLEDIRTYRENLLGSMGLTATFPLWGRATADLSRQTLDKGVQAVVCSCDYQRLDQGFVGRLYDREFIKDLPAGCDPCGENGEFHTFVFNGPGFRHSVAWERGPVSRRGSVDFCDLIPLQLP